MNEARTKQGKIEKIPDELRANKEEKPQTDQQATNAALATLAAAGNSFALGQLWEINKGFLHRMFWKWYSQPQNKTAADNAGLTLEDFDQESFFAVQAAAQAYDPSKGAFSTLLGYYVQSQINKAIFGEHRMMKQMDDGRTTAVSANPLNACTSLDAPLDSDDDGSGTLGDTQEDPSASAAMQAAEDEIYTQELHAALEEALSRLKEREADVLRRRYYEGQSLRVVGEEIGVHCERVRQIESGAFRRLRNDSRLKRWHDDIISTRAWKGTGWNAWNRYGSAEECAVEYVERLEEERRAREAEWERLRAERKAEQEKQRAEQEAVALNGRQERPAV